MHSRSAHPAAVVFFLALAACSATSAGTEPESGPFGSGGASGGSGAAAGGGGGGNGGGLSLGSGSSAGAGTGAGGGAGGGECQALSQQAQTKFKPVDIIWAVDTSGSMNVERKAVETHLNTFAQKIIAAGIDAHVVLIADPGGMCIGAPLGKGSCPGGSQLPTFVHVEKYVGSHSALSAFVAFYPAYKPALRQKSLKVFTVVTDDNTQAGSINSAAEFTQAVANLEPGWFDDWKLSGIYCTGKGCSSNCAATGHTYNALVTQTSGMAGDLCGGNASGFTPVFDSLAKAIIESKALDCQWTIPPPPTGEVFDPAKVNVRFTSSANTTTDLYSVPSAAQCGPQGGWYYDDPKAPKTISVCPATCQSIQADPGGKIDILFGCVTVVQPS
jgi:hypothetical protein